MKSDIQRATIEGQEKWEEICKEIPPLNFKKEWDVKIIPPYGGTVARFVVNYNGKVVSVFLDWYGRLACEDEPYYELYPWEDDIKRYYLTETEELMKDIETVLEREGNKNE